jgi:hypothetical protein
VDFLNMAELSSLEQAIIGRKLAYNASRIKKLEAFLKGVPLGTVRFADAIITNAKIGSLSADKIESGRISVGTEILVNDLTDDRILIDDENIKISAPGIDVKTGDIKDMVLLNQEDAHKLSHSAFITTGSYTHGLGRKPIFFCFETDSSSSPTYFQLTKDARANSTQIVNIPNPSYLVVYREGI